MAFMQIMGADQVEYHRETIVGRADDHPGQALAYYASRGETPLVWGGRGAKGLGLSGNVTNAQYDAIYGPGGALDPTTGARLTTTKRPGLELTICAHKSVAVLGVIGRAEDMHQIMDAERDATLAYLDELTRTRGAERDRSHTESPTDGLLYATVRHATSREGDPSPHDHVLLANVVAMADDRGGWKAPRTALWRDHLHAATMQGRMASARTAVELGYGITPDNGPSGKLGHWAIAGVPTEVTGIFSKRAEQINQAMAERGYDSYRARNVAARATRKAKRLQPEVDLIAHWHAEMRTLGYEVADVVALVNEASASRATVRDTLSQADTKALVAEVLAPTGALAARKVFTRKDVMVAATSALYGMVPAEQGRVVDAVLANSEAVPLIPTAGATERAYSTASVIGTEQAVATTIDDQVARTDAIAVTPAAAARAIANAEERIGASLTEGQRSAIASIATSARGADLVVGVAGSGKTAALAALRDAYETAGYEVVGTSTSGQAARTLGREAGITQSRTLASLKWRLDHGVFKLSSRHAVILDEAAMTDDRDLLRLLTAAAVAKAKVIMVGDHRQLGPVGWGGSLEALVARYGGAVHVLDENVRQRDPAERAALEQLRSGKVADAVAFYAASDRIVVAPTRDEALHTMVGAWAADALAGLDTTMMAWRRANVAELNKLARLRWAEAGKLSGPELVVGQVAYAAGDRIVTLAPGAYGQLVTSETGTVSSVGVGAGAGTLVATMADGRSQPFGPDEVAADHLAHGYAVTVHRSQGATVTTAHAFEDGGGRELAYVKISRARERAAVYTVADSVEVAAEELAGLWSSQRRQMWAIDSGTPATEAAAVEASPKVAARMRQALRHGRLAAERDAVAAVIPADPSAHIAHVQRALARGTAGEGTRLAEQLAALVAQRDARDRWLDEHPEALERLARLDAELGRPAAGTTAAAAVLPVQPGPTSPSIDERARQRWVAERRATPTPDLPTPDLPGPPAPIPRPGPISADAAARAERLLAELARQAPTAPPDPDLAYSQRWAYNHRQTHMPYLPGATPPPGPIGALVRRPLDSLHAELERSRQAQTRRDVAEARARVARQDLVQATARLAAASTPREAARRRFRRPSTQPPNAAAVARAERDLAQTEGSVRATEAVLAATPPLPANGESDLHEAIILRAQLVEEHVLREPPPWLAADVARRVAAYPDGHPQLDPRRLASAYGGVATYAERTGAAGAERLDDIVGRPVPGEELARHRDAVLEDLELEIDQGAALDTGMDLGL